MIYERKLFFFFFFFGGGGQLVSIEWFHDVEVLSKFINPPFSFTCLSFCLTVYTSLSVCGVCLQVARNQQLGLELLNLLNAEVTLLKQRDTLGRAGLAGGPASEDLARVRDIALGLSAERQKVKQAINLTHFFHYQGCESSDFNRFQTFLLFTNLIFRLLMQFECVEKHIFSGISDYFRLFLTDTLTPCIVH